MYMPLQPLTSTTHQGDSAAIEPGAACVSVAGAASPVQALVLRHASRHAMHVLETPADTVVVRVPLTACVLRVKLETQWTGHGLLAEGSMHVSGARQLIRTDWQGAGEMVLLCIPLARWNESVHCEQMLTPGACMRSDATLLQLAKMLANATLEGADTAFARYMADAVYARVVVAAANHIEGNPTLAHRTLQPWRLQRVIRFVQEHIADAVTLADMATAAGMSPMHFAAQFRAATGQRPHHFLLQSRVQHAKTLLLDHSRSLIDVAQSVGFRTQSHFTTVFKNFERATPMQWRRSRVQDLA